MSPGYISRLITQAYLRIRHHVIQTRLEFDPTHAVWLKCELEQKTGSFKWRGALSKLSLLTPGQTIITASTGNHGLGVANAAVLFGLKAKIFLPQTASPKKVEKLLALGADLIHVVGDSLDAEMQGKQYATLHQLPWVSPYNDESIIAGQGTIGLEISDRIQELHRIYITVGGGGLISGIGSWIRQHHPVAEIVGCQPVNSPEMYLSILSGRVITAPESLATLSDGSAGPLEEDSITFPICQQVIDRFILVSEEEIEDAIRHLYSQHHFVAEGAAAVAMAAAMKDSQRHEGETSVVVLCGGNIDATIHERICKRVRE